TRPVGNFVLDNFYIAGVAASSKKFRAATEADAAGVVFLALLSVNHPGFAISGCFAMFIDRSATPPCGDARRGLATPKVPIRSRMLKAAFYPSRSEHHLDAVIFFVRQKLVSGES